MGGVSDVINAIGDAGEQVSLNLLLGYLETTYPFLKLPVINQIFEWITEITFDAIFSKLKLGSIQLATIIETASSESNFSQAAQANLTAQTSGDINAQAIAKQNLLDAARKFGSIYTP